MFFANFVEANKQKMDIGLLNSPEFKIRFGGQNHIIDVNTLVNSLIHATNIINDINDSLNVGLKINIKVNAFERGSFIVSIEVVAELMDKIRNLFMGDDAIKVATLLSGFGGFVALYQFLKGGKPKNIEKGEEESIIYNEKGDLLKANNIVINYYLKSENSKESLSKMFETLDDDACVETFEILNKDESPVITIDQNEFSDLSTYESSDEGDKIEYLDAELVLEGVTFNKKNKWRFFYNGNKITAFVKDPEFLNKVDNGLRFGIRDRFEVVLEIKKRFNPKYQVFVNHEYTVIRVKNHIQNGETSQTKLNFDQ